MKRKKLFTFLWSPRNLAHWRRTFLNFIKNFTFSNYYFKGNTFSMREFLFQNRTSSISFNVTITQLFNAIYFLFTVTLNVLKSNNYTSFSERNFLSEFPKWYSTIQKSTTALNSFMNLLHIGLCTVDAFKKIKFTKRKLKN